LNSDGVLDSVTQEKSRIGEQALNKIAEMALANPTGGKWNE